MKKALEMGPSLHMGPIRELGWGSLPWDFRRLLKEGSGTAVSLSV
jgi:predicted neutral ceramidase superfamily lipid hydrolase